MPIHRMPMRWADLDMLNHVNNVVYVDYAMEARAALVDDGTLPVDLPVRAVGVEFLRPLLLSTQPVVVESEVDGDTLRQEIRSGDGTAVFCRVTTEHGAPSAPEVVDSDAEPYPLRVRRSDLGPDGAATLVKMFEYSQESRVIVFSRLLQRAEPGRFVVARVDLAPAEPVRWRPDPIPVHTHVSRVGTSSLTLTSRIDGGRHGTTEAVLVAYDLATQRSRRLSEEEKELLSPAR